MAELDFKRLKEDCGAPKIELNYVHEGVYVAEVDITFLYDDHDWSPSMSFEDARKLDDVRLALERGDLKAAAGLGRVFEKTPVAAE